MLNVGSDGSVSLNSPANSASPGSYITIYGTGLGPVLNEPVDGTPALADPLSPALSGAEGAVFDFSPVFAQDAEGWQGRAPGFVGLDQFNVQIPGTVRLGCTVPLQLSGFNISQPVLISIANGGGQCVDLPLRATVRLHGNVP